MTTLLYFALCAAVILFAGRQLSYYGDLLAEKTGMGKAFIGLFLMSAVTSLPELMVGISSVRIVGSADLAAGDILGSCVFNLGIIAMMDAVLGRRGRPLLSDVSHSHILAAALGIVLMVLVGAGLFFEQQVPILPFLGLNSVLFAVVYFASARLIYQYQNRYPDEAPSHAPDELADSLSLRQVILRYSAFGGVTIIAALLLPGFAEHIAEVAGLGKSFVGTAFLAFSTSLPEIAVCISAVRLGSANLAVGNVLGSNLFNVFILFLDDLFYTRGHLLQDASQYLILSVFAVIIMSAAAILGMIYRAPVKRLWLGFDTGIIVAVYLLNMVLLYYFTLPG